jgi:hypothetical protein
MLALAACATPPERYDAFAGGMAAHAAGVAREAERLRQLPLPAVPADCRNTAELAAPQRERCAAERRMAVTALVNRHAQALAEYAAALAILGTRFDASPAMPAAGMVWLIMDLTEPSATLACGPWRSPRMRLMAPISVRSPVPVTTPMPWP